MKPDLRERKSPELSRTKEWLVGFYLVDCANEEVALDRAKVICANDEHAVEVRRVTWEWKP